MRMRFFIFLIGVLLLGGCASATSISGRDFDTSKVPLIQKGKTTQSEIVAWFGQPFTKSVSGADGEIWTYFYSTAHAKVKGVIKIEVLTTGITRKLDVLFKNDKVENSTFSETPISEVLRSGADKTPEPAPAATSR